jgi:PadR family transcriptional regulator PadR
LLARTMVAASTKPLILSILLTGEDYGYSIIQRVKDLSGGAITWSDTMLYPFLKRLEDDGSLSSRWRLSEGGRLRKYYRITDKGRAEWGAERRQWLQVHAALAALWERIPAPE